MLSRALTISTLASKIHTNHNFLRTSVLTLQIANKKYDYKQKRYYKNFGHKPDKVPLVTKLWYTFVLCGVIFPALNYDA